MRSSLDPTPLPMRVVKRVFTPLVLRGLRVDVARPHHVPGAGGVVLAANHLSLLDPIVLAAAAPRPPWFLGKQELARGLLGVFTQRLGMVAVKRGVADLFVLDVLIDHLRAGAAVGIFPEGSRSATGELYRFRGGMGPPAPAPPPPGARGAGGRPAGGGPPGGGGAGAGGAAAPPPPPRGARGGRRAPVVGHGRRRGGQRVHERRLGGQRDVLRIARVHRVRVEPGADAQQHPARAREQLA
jgi:1-acyl-sn-glycerol-3-phosphate acyltransferase